MEIQRACARRPVEEHSMEKCGSQDGITIKFLAAAAPDDVAIMDTSEAPIA